MENIANGKNKYMKTTCSRSIYLPFGKPNFSHKEIEAVTRVLSSGWIGMGPETIAFENELAEYLNVPYVITVNSCTSALFLSLLVHGIGAGDEVICPSLTWFSTANVILYLGGIPVFCDIDPETLCITPEKVAEKISSRTRAVIVVHMGGYPVNVDEIKKVVPEHVALIEDAAHAMGSKFEDGRPVGSSGNLTCFSFYANKNLSTGEGGAISLFDEGIAQRLSSLRQHGLTADAWKRYIQPQSAIAPEIEELGYKMNYTDLQASIGRVQLKRMEEFAEIRKEIALIYYEGLKGTGIKYQKNCIDEKHSRHLFVVLLPIEQLKISRNEIIVELRKHNIGAAIHYTPLHTMFFYDKSYRAKLPNTDYVGERIMTLPISASINAQDAKLMLVDFFELLSDSLRKW